jgi:RNA polymerase sigma factor (sigma-70 family)
MVSRSADEQRAFCQREHGRLVAAMHLYTGEREPAYELAQEALARACRDWDKVGRMQAPGVWAYRVALNLARSQFRRRQAERRARARLALDRPEQAIDRDDVLVVREAIGRLASRQRAAVVLRYYAGMSVSETATAMRCRDGTVRALTAQALKRLRRELLPDGSEESHHAT